MSNEDTREEENKNESLTFQYVLSRLFAARRRLSDCPCVGRTFWKTIVFPGKLVRNVRQSMGKTRESRACRRNNIWKGPRKEKSAAPINEGGGERARAHLFLQRTNETPPPPVTLPDGFLPLSNAYVKRTKKCGADRKNSS